MAEEVNHLPRWQRFDRPVRLFPPIHQIGGKGMPQTVESFLLDPHCRQYAIEPLPQIDRLGVPALLVAHKGAPVSGGDRQAPTEPTGETRILAEVEPLA